MGISKEDNVRYCLSLNLKRNSHWDKIKLIRTDVDPFLVTPRVEGQLDKREGALHQASPTSKAPVAGRNNDVLQGVDEKNTDSIAARTRSKTGQFKDSTLVCGAVDCPEWGLWHADTSTTGKTFSWGGGRTGWSFNDAHLQCGNQDRFESLDGVRG